ncbi:uncharacterized protein LOC116772691 [Danaus plexippus]|uniref:Uncharacterized protein n=1 Tax=Danaus plexippus plexippus TaxID=278856 RepID=A0A212FLU0_DANPL|nr:uncharacterized protein LOC116772691 [Danaus plexippus]OWR54696.1 hypothetical protein KGM_212350 [Danaus plexippus plexippus]
MQETVTNERKSLFSSFLEVLEAREKQAQADRQLQEEKYQRRTQRIYEFHERQQREAAELQRCVEFVSQHAGVLESVLRGAGGSGGDAVPLSAALVRHAAALQRCMAQCVANASRIRHLLTAAHQPQMDSMLAKMEAELSTWTAFLQRAVDATYNTEVVIDNLQNLVAEQKRCVREVSASSVYTALCGPPDPADDTDGGSTGTPRAPGSEGSLGPHTPGTRRAPSAACSTPLSRD